MKKLIFRGEILIFDRRPCQFFFSLYMNLRKPRPNVLVGVFFSSCITRKFLARSANKNQDFSTKNLFFLSRFFLAPGYVRGPSFPAVSRHFGHPQKKQYEKSLQTPRSPFLKQPPSYIIKYTRTSFLYYRDDNNKNPPSK